MAPLITSVPMEIPSPKGYLFDPPLAAAELARKWPLAHGSERGLAAIPVGSNPPSDGAGRGTPL